MQSAFYSITHLLCLHRKLGLYNNVLGVLGHSKHQPKSCPGLKGVSICLHTPVSSLLFQRTTVEQLRNLLGGHQSLFFTCPLVTVHGSLLLDILFMPGVGDTCAPWHLKWRPEDKSGISSLQLCVDSGNQILITTDRKELSWLLFQTI